MLSCLRRGDQSQKAPQIPLEGLLFALSGSGGGNIRHACLLSLLIWTRGFMEAVEAPLHLGARQVEACSGISIHVCKWKQEL